MWAIRSHTISSILQVSCVLCPQPYSKLRSDIIVQWIDKMDIFAFTKQTIIYFFLSFVSSINTLRIPEIAMFNILCFTMMKRINSTPSLNAYPVERRKSHSGGRHGSKTRCNKLSSHPINWTLPCTWPVATRRRDQDTVSLPTTAQLVHSTGRSINGLVRIYNDVEHFLLFTLYYLLARPRCR